MGRTRTQDRPRKLRDWRLWNRFGRGGLPARVFPLKWECAKKGFLAHLQRIGPSGGLGAALLVGGVRHHSHRLCELVGGLSKRLVLKRPRTHVCNNRLALFGQVSQKRNAREMT